MNKRELKEMIDQQRESINKLVSDNMIKQDKIDKLQSECEQSTSAKIRLEHSISEIDKYFERVKRALGLDIITHGTHRARDLYYKRQVLNGVTIQDVFINNLYDTDDSPC